VTIEKPNDGQHRSYGSELPVVALENKIKVLILQHPQEPDRLLGSAVLCVRSLASAELKIGLSWPSFAKLLGQPVDAAKWGVLYLGSQKEMPPMQPGQIVVLDKKGNPIVGNHDLEGIIILDGTWSQAKTMWWRNAWLLKLKRIILKPARVSRYGNLRREPRKEALSTIEAVAQTLRALGEAESTSAQLEQNFEAMLLAYRRER
jgi:DTW domain-containing protein YfiP